MRSRPGPSRSYAPGHSRHLSDYVRVIHKRRWTALLGLMVIFVAGAFKSLETTPLYEATTQIQIEDGTHANGTRTSVLEAQQQPLDEDDFYMTQCRILQSRALAWRAVDALGLSKPSIEVLRATEPGWFEQSLAWISERIGAPHRITPPPADETTAQSHAIDGFLASLDVEPVRNTRRVELTYRSADPVFAARAANAVAEQYRQQNLQSRILASKETNSWLDQQLAEQQKLVQDSEMTLQQYRETHDVVAAGAGQSVAVQRLADLNAEHVRKQTERFQKEAVYIAAQRQTLPTEVNTAVQAVETEYLAAKAAEDDIKQAVETQKREQIVQGRMGIEYAALERDAAGNRQLYENLLQMAKEISATEQSKGRNITIVDRADVPREPILPHTSRDLMTAFLGGCLLGVGLVFGFEYIDSRIKTPDEIKSHLGLTFLGIVPTAPTRNGESILIGNPVPQAFSEAIRAVRTSVIFSSADEGARTIVVTSTAPHEGKSSVASNLAVSLAQTDQRTLVIDGDMRRPRIHEMFNRAQEPGLSNVLVGTATLRDAVRSSNVPNLWVMPAGHVPPSPAELLGSNRYIKLMAELQEQYDWIVIDAPPVMAVTDATVIAHTATGVLFVVGAEMTPRRNAIAAVEQLAGARAKFIGAVLNRVSVERHSYYSSPHYKQDYSRVYTRATQ